MISIRQANAADVPGLARLNIHIQNWHVAAYPDHFNDVSDPTAFEGFWLEMITSSTHEVFLAETDGKAVGYVMVEHQTREQNTFMLPVNRLYLHHIHVENKYRRTGTGRTLMQKVELLAAGKSEIALDTWQLNTAAQAFFQALGFRTHRLLLHKKLT